MNELMIILLENNCFLYAACAVAGTGGLIQIILSVIYNRSLAASDRMRNTKIVWLRQMKTRYESGYEWNNRIRNVELFVDKNMGRRKWLGIYLKTWEEFGKMMLPLTLVIAFLGAVCAGTYTEDRSEVLSLVASGIIPAVLLRGIIVLVNLKEKQALLRTNLCEYFENTLRGEVKNRRREKREQDNCFSIHKQREEIACTIAEVAKCEETAERTENVGLEEGIAQDRTEVPIEENAERGQEKEELYESKKEVSEPKGQRHETEKKLEAVAKNNRRVLRQEKKQARRAERLAKKEAKLLKKQEARMEKEAAKLRRKQQKEQKRVDKLTKRMERMKQRLGTAATVERNEIQRAAYSRKEESARLKREQLKRKVDVTPAQEDQILAEVLREFLA